MPTATGNPWADVAMTFIATVGSLAVTVGLPLLRELLEQRRFRRHTDKRLDRLEERVGIDTDTPASEGDPR